MRSTAHGVAGGLGQLLDALQQRLALGMRVQRLAA
jgi:hypothetical protein